MVAVSTSGGIAYGLRTALTLGVVLLVALGCTVVGTTTFTDSYIYDFRGLHVADWRRLVGGFVLSAVGLVALCGGASGLLYKVVADGVRRGNSRTA